ncbi:unnamed protein product [Mytilus coruscus]|uniref:Ig-like domain-containing protein n=1 Tax=Mytilus coruscus TaxID=42192 RepID=A0A6J8CX07_MYTCO|nr:unnamed protein product [Mytilus coruscus]
MINPNIPILLFTIFEHCQFEYATNSSTSFTVEINSISLDESNYIQQIYLKVGHHAGKARIVSASPLPNIKLEAHILQKWPFEWYLINEAPVVFGETIKLECRVGGIRYLQPDTHWIWTIDNREQIYDQQTTRNTKYENCGSLSRTFNLCIHNFSESDLRINIKCAYGFRSYEQKINLYNEKYEYHPTEDDRSVNIRTENMSLNITMNFYKVFPMPICFVQKNDGAEKMSVQSKVKHGLFHRVILFLTTEVSSVPCGEQLEIKCTAAGYSETINSKRMIDCKSHTDVSSGSYILNVSHYEMFILSFIISKILPAK